MFRTEHIRIDPAYRERLRAGGLDTVERVLTRVAGRVAAWSRTTDTLYVAGAGGEPGFYIKRHFFPTWNKRLRGTFRGTFFGMHRGQSEYLALDAMRSLGIPAVRAVAFGGWRVAHFLSACFLITEEVPGAQNLTTFATNVATGRRSLPSTQRFSVIRALATQVARMHATGLPHGNLFWRNVLIRYGPGGQPEFFFLDPQPMRPWQRFNPGGSWWIRELAQLAVSASAFTTRSDWCRFVRSYVDARPVSELKSHLRQIDRLAQTWRRHEDRRIHMNRLFEQWNRQLAMEERRPLPDGRVAGAVEPSP